MTHKQWNSENATKSYFTTHRSRMYVRVTLIITKCFFIRKFQHLSTGFRCVRLRRSFISMAPLMISWYSGILKIGEIINIFANFWRICRHTTHTHTHRHIISYNVTGGPRIAHFILKCTEAVMWLRTPPHHYDY